MFIEITAGNQRNSPGFEISGHNVVTGCVCPVLQRRHIAVRTRIKRAISTSERNITADRCALDAWLLTQYRKELLSKTLTRRSVCIFRCRHGDRAGPQIMRLESEVLLRQPYETRD